MTKKQPTINGPARIDVPEFRTNVPFRQQQRGLAASYARAEPILCCAPIRPRAGTEPPMQRITITVDDDLMHDLDRLIAKRGYQNRSEAIRDLARAGLQQAALEEADSRDCVGALVYVYDHGARDLAKRLVHSSHAHHHLALSTLHVHLDHESCMEVTLLRGGTRDVQQFADQVIAERGVRHGRLYLVPVEVDSEVHAHAGEPARRHTHVHVHRKR
jgi:CopG family nickel-responsive transcriptional regulator